MSPAAVSDWYFLLLIDPFCPKTCYYMLEDRYQPAISKPFLRTSSYIGFEGVSSMVLYSLASISISLVSKLRIESHKKEKEDGNEIRIHEKINKIYKTRDKKLTNDGISKGMKEENHWKMSKEESKRWETKGIISMKYNFLEL